MKTNFEAVKDSGVRENFSTGSVRDTREGKGRFDLISPIALERLAKHYENGAKKYGDRNWEKGQSLSRYADSALRHMNKVMLGLQDEDHLAAAVWNLMCIMHTQSQITAGNLPEELDDLPSYQPVDSTFRSVSPEQVDKMVRQFQKDMDDVSIKRICGALISAPYTAGTPEVTQESPKVPEREGTYTIFTHSGDFWFYPEGAPDDSHAIVVRWYGAHEKSANTVKQVKDRAHRGRAHSLEELKKIRKVHPSVTRESVMSAYDRLCRPQAPKVTEPGETFVLFNNNWGIWYYRGEARPSDKCLAVSWYADNPVHEKELALVGHVPSDRETVRTFEELKKKPNIPADLTLESIRSSYDTLVLGKKETKEERKDIFEFEDSALGPTLWYYPHDADPSWPQLRVELCCGEEHEKKYHESVYRIDEGPAKASQVFTDHAEFLKAVGPDLGVSVQQLRQAYSRVVRKLPGTTA